MNLIQRSLSVFKGLLAVLFFTSCSLLVAQQSLNDDAVTKMVNGGLSDELIIATINLRPGTYDTSADGLIALKKANVSDKVVAAIVKKASGVTQAVSLPDAIPPAGAPIEARAAATHSEELVNSQPIAGPSTKIRVYISSASKGSNRNTARDQSMEMAKDFEKNCPDVRITINQSAADYTVLLNHIEHGLLVRDNQIQVANKDGDLITRTKEGGSIKGGAKKACELILADWAKR